VAEYVETSDGRSEDLPRQWRRAEGGPESTPSGEPSSLDLSGVFLHWPPRSVAQTDPYDFGISTGADRPGLGLNPYVPRDVDAELNRAMQSSEVHALVVVAEQGSGAKRTIFEALRRNRPENPLLIPRQPLPEDREFLYASGIDRAYPGSILWLPDLAGFADRSGAFLLQHTEPHELVVGLIRPGELQLLEQQRSYSGVREIQVPVALSDRERAAARDRYPHAPVGDHHIGFAFGGTTRTSLSSSAREAVARALWLASQRPEGPDEVDATMLFLGALAHAVSVTLVPGVTSAFVEFLVSSHPDHPEATALLERLAAAALGVRDVETHGRVSVDDTVLTRPPLSRLLAQAGALARRAASLPEAHLKHVLASAVASKDPPLSSGLLDELRLSDAALRDGLLGAVRRGAPGEGLEEWDDFLTSYGELAGRISADRVDPTKGISLKHDDLDLRVYVTMFATAIAREKTPMPLSIGIFGEWGSGKSTFMGLLRGKVQELADSGSSAYVGEVVQIGFNAWHYADSNLWASLGDEIFRQLVGPGERPEDRRENLRQELSQRLAQRQDLEAATARARAETARLQAQLDAAVATRDVEAKALIKAIMRSSELQNQAQKAWKRLGIDDEIEQGRMLAEELRGATSEADALRRSLAGPRGRIATAVAVVALLAVAAAALLPTAIGAWLGRGGLATLATLAAAAVGMVARVRSGLGELRRVARDLQERTDEAAFREEITALREAEAHERVVHAQLEEVVVRVGELGRQLTELDPGVRLYRFLAERAGGDAYARHLGLISTIRKDFEQLIALMEDWKKHPGGEGRRPIDRIVLYIDDLDRCSPQQVVDVLQAVHLLLALDLFVVVVGVDPRWLLRSLRRQYRNILTARATPSGRQDPPGWDTTPEDYLEKIFNIPFALPGMGKGSLERLLRSLDTEKPEKEPERSGAADDIDDVRPPDGVSPAPSLQPEASPGDGREPPMGSAEIPAEPGSEVAEAQRGASERPTQPLTPPELQLLAALEPLVDTPREAKRLLNLYQLLRSTRDLSTVSGFLGNDETPGEFQAVILLLGLLTAHARLLGQVLDTPPSQDPLFRGGLLHRPDGESWADFVKGFQPREVDRGWMNDIAGRIRSDDAPEWRRLGGGIEQASRLVTLPDLTAFRTWAPRIRRFSFVLSPLAVNVPPEATRPGSGH
jgi:hypothetical protein